jgi:hypothetical protein
LLDIYWNILTMHGPINVKSPNNISKWQMGFNSAFEGLINTTGLYARILKGSNFLLSLILVGVNK